MNSRTDEADQLFAELAKVSVSQDVKNTIIGVVRDLDGAPKIFKGPVVAREDGFLFVSFPDLGKDVFVFRGEVRNKDWSSIKYGSIVEGKVGFTYRGPCGTDVRLPS
jgi:cold shock CspA family protein